MSDRQWNNAVIEATKSDEFWDTDIRSISAHSWITNASYMFTNCYGEKIVAKIPEKGSKHKLLVAHSDCCFEVKALKKFGPGVVPAPWVMHAEEIAFLLSVVGVAREIDKLREKEQK